MLGTSGLFIPIIRVLPDLVTPRVRTLSQWTEVPVSQEDTRSISEIKLQVTNSIHTCKKTCRCDPITMVQPLGGWVLEFQPLGGWHPVIRSDSVFSVFDRHVFSGSSHTVHLGVGGGTGCLGLRTHLCELSNWKRCFPQVLRSEQFHQTNKLNVFSTIYSWLLWKMLKLLLPWFFGSIPGIVSDAKPLPVASYLEDGFPQLRGEQSPWLLATYSTGWSSNYSFHRRTSSYDHCCFEPHEIH